MIERRTHDQPVAVERRKRGRPPLADGDPSADLTLKMEGSLYDRVYAIASARRMTVPEYVRAVLRASCS